MMTLPKHRTRATRLLLSWWAVDPRAGIVPFSRPGLVKLRLIRKRAVALRHCLFIVEHRRESVVEQYHRETRAKLISCTDDDPIEQSERLSL